MNKNYTPIATKLTKEFFFDYIDNIDIPEIDYFAVGIQSCITKKSISLMSLPEWQKQFDLNQYVEHDPLRKATLSTKRNFIPFTEIDCVDNFGKEIMRQRSIYGLKNGIVLMERLGKYNYMITLGTGFLGFDSLDFIKRYYFRLYYLKNDLIKIIKNDAIRFLMQEIIQPIF
ncbi:MAG: hypothetical protein ACD_46C00083G0004 [uncultured bacterium]|nr:MAG: hypothetical protein ACD_46C00083G0004 [uncultured bacterium]